MSSWFIKCLDEVIYFLDEFLGVVMRDLNFLVTRDLLGFVFGRVFTFAFAFGLFAGADLEGVWDENVLTPVLAHYHHFAVLKDNFLMGPDAVPQQGRQGG